MFHSRYSYFAQVLVLVLGWALAQLQTVVV
jgi:hypothetical protein